MTNRDKEAFGESLLAVLDWVYHREASEGRIHEVIDPKGVRHFMAKKAWLKGYFEEQEAFQYEPYDDTLCHEGYRLHLTPIAEHKGLVSHVCKECAEQRIEWAIEVLGQYTNKSPLSDNPISEAVNTAILARQGKVA